MARLESIMHIICIIYMIAVKSDIYRFYQIRGQTWSNAPDVNVVLGQGVTTDGGNRWTFNVTSQSGADLTIELGSQTWGLSDTLISHYNIQFQGTTKTENNAELLIVVSAGDYYFAQTISLDTASQQYQECPAGNSPLIQGDVNDMINSETPNRYDRFCSNSDWNDQGFEASAIWPMGFFIYNDPMNNMIEYSWYHDFINDDEIIDVSSSYTTAFPSNEDLKIYISGNKMGQSFTISRINLFYQTYGIPTTEPTADPTQDPITEKPTTTRPTAQLGFSLAEVAVPTPTPTDSSAPYKTFYSICVAFVLFAFTML